jgi:hypothetical protein
MEVKIWPRVGPIVSTPDDRENFLTSASPQAFSAAAAKRFGSGWAWMGVSPDGKIVIDSTPNQDNPLMDGVNCQKMIPILGLDVWCVTLTPGPSTRSL